VDRRPIRRGYLGRPHAVRAYFFFDVSGR
jgi:hypothetical protein